MRCPACDQELIAYENFQTDSPVPCPFCGVVLLLNYDEDIDPETGDDLPLWSWEIA